MTGSVNTLPMMGRRRANAIAIGKKSLQGIEEREEREGEKERRREGEKKT